MSLTYSQKRYIQDHFQGASTKQIAQRLNVPQQAVELHIKKNPLFFAQYNNDANSPKRVSLSETYSYLALFAMIVITLYANGLFNAFVSDDIFVLVDDEKIYQSWSYFLINPTMIIREAIYFFVYQAFGLAPAAYRIFNILFHMGFVWMVYLIMPFFTEKKNLPIIVATLAAVHPMMVESVTWISGGVYAQAGFFALLSFYLYIRARTGQKSVWYIYSLFSFLAALSSSEKTIIFPFIIFLYEVSLGGVKKSWKQIGSFFTLSFLWGLILLGRVNDRLEYLQVTNGAESKFQFNNPFVQVPVALSKYFELFAWPDKLTLYQSEYAMGPAQFALRAVVTIVFFILIAVSYKKNKAVFFWLSFFFITLLTTLNPFGLSWIVAERYSYLGSIGLYFGFTTFFFFLIERTKLKTLGYTILVVILLGLSARTIVRNLEWRNEDTLWVSTARVSQADPKTHNNLGDVYARKGDLENAGKSFEKALQLNPNYPDATHNLANIYRMQGKVDEAVNLYKRAIELNPTIWQSHLNLAAIYFDRQEYVLSKEHAIAADKIHPDDPQILANLGLILLTGGESAQARSYFDRTLQLDPQNQIALQGIVAISSTTAP